MAPQTLNVLLGERSYPIVIGAGLLADTFDLRPYLAGKRCLVVSNETVAPLYLAQAMACLPAGTTWPVVLPDGEAYKTMATAGQVIDELVAGKAGRDATVVALGGGVVGDIAGFAAACYMRGVAFVQIPTTLLAQVDSSVGGKTGVNHPGGKNLIGAFHQPAVVLIDTATLASLPDRELKAGIAEIIKYGAILDEAFFSWLERNMQKLLARDPDTLAFAITRSCELKAAVVADDEREQGRRALLNFGHTFGHAIENTMGYGEWLHGEAVAAGMVMAAKMSELPQGDIERLTSLIAAAGLPIAPPPAGAKKLREAMQMDKKSKGNQLRFILLKGIGDAFASADYPGTALENVLLAADR